MPRLQRSPRPPSFAERGLFAVLVLSAAILAIGFLDEAGRFLGTPAPSVPDWSEDPDWVMFAGVALVGVLGLSALSAVPLLFIVLGSVGPRGLRPCLKPAVAIAISSVGLIVLDAWDSPQRASRAMAPVVEAIQRFERDHSAPPARLEELVPDYIAAIPATGCPSFSFVRYERYEQNGTSRSWSLWFESWQPTRFLRYEPERGREGHDVLFQSHRYGDWVLTVHGVQLW